MGSPEFFERLELELRQNIAKMYVDMRYPTDTFLNDLRNPIPEEKKTLHFGAECSFDLLDIYLKDSGFHEKPDELFGARDGPDRFSKSEYDGILTQFGNSLYVLGKSRELFKPSEGIELPERITNLDSVHWERDDPTFAMMSDLALETINEEKYVRRS